MAFAKEFDMTKDQEVKCHAIIHAATAASGGTSFFTAQIPLADSAVIVPAQMAMVVGLAGVFGYKLSEGIAEALIGPITAQQMGQAAAKTLVGLIPIAGNITKAGISVAFTEALGWYVASKFAEGKARELDPDEAVKFVKDEINNFDFNKTSAGKRASNGRSTGNGRKNKRY